MKKRLIIILITVLVLLALTVGVMYLFNFGFFKQDGYEMLLDLNFDDSKDADWFNLYGDNIEGIYANDQVIDGMYILNYESEVKYKLDSDTLIHVRIKPKDLEKTIDPRPLMFFDINCADSKNGEGFRLYFNNRDLIMLEPHNYQGFFGMEFKGSAMLASPVWMDVIIYLDETNRVMTVVVSESESYDSIIYLTCEFPEQWPTSPWNIVMFQDGMSWSDMYEMGEASPEIDFIRYAKGSLQGYLKDNIKAYGNNEDEIEDYFAKEPKIIDEDKYMNFG